MPHSVSSVEELQRSSGHRGPSQGKAWDSHGHTRPIEQLEGTWVNADRPREQYVVEGLRITRTDDSRGTRQIFSIRWDARGQRWQWGTHGKLSLDWLADDFIAWTSGSSRGRVWRWQRSGPLPPRRAASAGVSSSSAAESRRPSLEASSYGPWRRPVISRGEEHGPYSRQPYGQPSWPAPTWDERPSRGWDPEGRDHMHSSRRRDRDHREPYPRDHRRLQHHREHRDWRMRGLEYARSSSNRGSCGLSTMEVFDLLSREITPDDYDMLLRLDAGVEKKAVADPQSVEALPAVPCEEFMGGDDCAVCLVAFESHDSVVELPCRHQFHRGCIARWLKECRRTCPLCGTEALPKSSEASAV